MAIDEHLQEVIIPDLVEGMGATFGLDPVLVAAVVLAESSAKTNACRYEPGFFTRYILGRSKKRLGGHWPKTISEKTERRSRAFSWGLMQVMGQTARELGFKGESLVELCSDPAVGLWYGCKKLSACMTAAGNEHGALLKYNGGENKFYPEYVAQFMPEAKAWLEK